MIKNFNELTKGRFAKERADALSALTAAIERVLPENCIKNVLKLQGHKILCKNKEYDIESYEHIYLIAFGKAAERMAKSVLDVLSSAVTNTKIAGAVCVTKEFKGLLPPFVKKITGGHPIPDEQSVLAGEEILKLAKETGERDLTIILISGGGSAMVESPLVPLKDLQHATKVLMESGANIEELNAVRKHLSNIKGGRLLAHIKGDVLALIISDVIGDELGTIASGPTYFDKTTFKDALSIIDKYGIESELPESVITVLKKGAKGELLETLKEREYYEKSVENVLVATNFDAGSEAVKYLKNEGYSVLYLGDAIQGEAREVAKVFGGVAQSAYAGKLSVNGFPFALVFGGETTVTVKGSGVGGRNEEFVLAVLPFLSKTKAVIASIGTDGIDGRSNAAGAIADSDTLILSEEMGVDYSDFLRNNDAHHFFERAGGLIFTGNTGTNVADIGVLIVVR